MANITKLGVQRCGWLTNDPLYIAYHDEEWGKPEYDSSRLFEMINLEGQQAGLSWLTILKKRENYRKHFHNFDTFIISKYTEKDIDLLARNPDIVRHRKKIEAIVNNAKCFIEMENSGENFSKFIWDFVNNKPVIHTWKDEKDIPTESPESIAMAKALKKNGFKYVGSTICYAFMQACGLVDDHITGCVSKNV